jgi:hypothetical protein
MTLNKVGDQFTLQIDQKKLDFKITSVQANGGFKAAPVTAKMIDAFGVTINEKIALEYKKAQSTSEKDSLSLTGIGLYDKVRMDVKLPFQLGDAADIKFKVESGVAGPPELSAPLAPGPTESQAQGSWRGHAGAGFVGTAPVPWPSLLPVLI